MIIVGKNSEGHAVVGEGAVTPKADDSSSTTARARKIFTSALIGAALSLELPLPSNANPLFAEINNPSTSLAGSFGTPNGSSSTPYFNSASAARLLVDPTPSSRGSPEARRQLAKQRALQDSRLEQCRESGIDWEQCFYYGTGGPGDPAAPLTLPSIYDVPSSADRKNAKSNSNFNVGGSAMAKGVPRTKLKIPTW
jgi:hypothetical protein